MSNKAILCVDDEKMVLNSLKAELRKTFGDDFIIEIAEDAEEALDIFDELLKNNYEVPVIISDYIMPGVKGDELLKRIHIISPKTLKILLTGQADVKAIGNVVNYAKLYRYIEKPWEHSDLSLTVSEAIKSYYQEKRLEDQNIELMKMSEAFVETMVAALDTRDTTSAGHSKRLAEYSLKMVEAINRVDYGKFKDFSFTEDEIRELYFSALLHDIGKIGVREHVLLKHQRLSDDRWALIESRFNYYKSSMELKKQSGESSSEEDEILVRIDEYLQLINEICRRNYITDEEEEKIKHIASISFTDIHGKTASLLDEYEVENLCVKKGNLTDDERQIINLHAVHTFNILKGIPWAKGLENVPEIAASHHEKLDGTGYFKGLDSEKISVQSRILAILDIFEALTSQDRPYKPPMPVEAALEVLRDEVNMSHLDKDLFEIFVKERVYSLNN